MQIVELIKRRFPFEEPDIVKLPQEESAWSEVLSVSVSIPSLEISAISDNLLTPNVPEFWEGIQFEEFEVINVDQELANLPFDIVDILHPIIKPQIEGTIFVKKEQEQTIHGEKKQRTRVEAVQSKVKFDPKAPKGLDIFEMLLPVLMPPIATEFSDELFFPAELFPFQRAGVKWLFENSSALLADDMGLGKTVQAITAFRALLRRSQALQALVICPLSVLTNWMRELEKWAPELVAVRVYGNQTTRRIQWKALHKKCHVLVTTYDTIRQDAEILKNGLYDVIIADEIQRIKNSDTATSRAVRSLNGKRKWGMTGTPLENKIDDVINIFSFIKKGLFSSSELPYISTREVRNRITPYILRRRKQDALPQLLKKMYVDTKYLELTDSQRKCYDSAENEGVKQLKTNQSVSLQNVLALIQALKQICNFDPHTGESTKIAFLQDYLEEACSDQDKVIVVSQYVETLKEINQRIGDYGPLLYSGSLSPNQRAEAERHFRDNEEHKVLLLSLKAGGVGLNLTRANYLLHFDQWWNPAIEEQASARIHRIGQMKDVFISRLICSDTIEERIENILERKKILFTQVVDELADEKLEKVLSEEELFGLFGLKPPQRGKAPVEETQESTPPYPVLRGTPPSSSVISPEEPYSNIVRMRDILRSSEEYIYWADKHFAVRALEEFIITADPSQIRSIKILSGPDNVDRRAKREFQRFKQELANKGVSAEWKILMRFAHDRYLMSKNYCYNVPPVNSWFRNQYSEVLETKNRPPFERWWEEGIPIENVNVNS